VGARSLIDLYTIFKVSIWIISLTVCHPSFLIIGLEEASYLLLVTIVGARFWSFFSSFIAVEPQLPHTGQQYLKSVLQDGYTCFVLWEEGDTFWSVSTCFVLWEEGDTFWSISTSLFLWKLFLNGRNLFFPVQVLINHCSQIFCLLYDRNNVFLYIKERFYSPFFFYVVQALPTTYHKTLFLGHIEG